MQALHSLLDAAVFQVRTPDGRSACLSLPEVLASLAGAEDLVFTRLRPHQRPAWHAFLVQLACLALDLVDEPALPKDSVAWRDLLRALTPDHPDDAPWHLLHPDWRKPAFLQAPCSAEREVDFKRSADSAQDIDILVTARHHDEKSGKLRLTTDQLDTLVYALVMLQGWSGFMGAGNFQTMRMNGGFSSRPQFRLVYARGTGAEFLRDVNALREGFEALRADFRSMHGTMASANPHRLLWLLPWDDGSLAASDVHPLALEVCRRVRLVVDRGELRLRRAASQAMRVAAKEMRGVVLDPWVPIVHGAEPKALTAQRHTLGYRKLQELLFDKSAVDRPRLAMDSESERALCRAATLLAQVIVSGDGGTDGLLAREVDLPPSVVSRLRSPDQLAGRSRAFVERASEVAGKVLRPSLMQFIDGSEDVDRQNRDFDRAVAPWLEEFDAAVDAEFFGMLFDSIESSEDNDAADRRWVQWLGSVTERLLAEATASLPTRHVSRLIARAKSESMRRRTFAKHFGAALDLRRLPST